MAPPARSLRRNKVGTSQGIIDWMQVWFDECVKSAKTVAAGIIARLDLLGFCMGTLSGLLLAAAVYNVSRSFRYHQALRTIGKIQESATSSAMVSHTGSYVKNGKDINFVSYEFDVKTLHGRDIRVCGHERQVHDVATFSTISSGEFIKVKYLATNPRQHVLSCDVPVVRDQLSRKFTLRVITSLTLGCAGIISLVVGLGQSGVATVLQTITFLVGAGVVLSLRGPLRKVDISEGSTVAELGHGTCQDENANESQDEETKLLR